MPRLVRGNGLTPYIALIPVGLGHLSLGEKIKPYQSLFCVTVVSKRGMKWNGM